MIFAGYLIPCPFHDWTPHRIMELRWAPRVERYLGPGTTESSSGRLEDVKLECGAHFDPLTWLIYVRRDDEGKFVKVTSNPPAGDEPEIKVVDSDGRRE